MLPVKSRTSLCRVPRGQGSSPENRFGGPATQIHGKSYAVTAVAAQNYCARALRMVPEYRPPLLRDQYRAAPLMRESHALQHWMQRPDSSAEMSEECSCLACRDIQGE